MKWSQKTIAGILAQALLWQPASASTSPVAGITAGTSAQLTEARGTVYKRGFIDWTREEWGDPEPAAVGDVLLEGSQLGTGDKSWAQVSWPNVTTRAWANTVFAIAPNQRLVYLIGGEMLFNLKKERKDKKDYVVWTKVLQARIRGTTVLVQATPTVSRISVLEGCVDVMNRLDHSVMRVKPGVVYEIRTPAASGPPPGAAPAMQGGLPPTAIRAPESPAGLGTLAVANRLDAAPEKGAASTEPQTSTAGFEQASSSSGEDGTSIDQDNIAGTKPPGAAGPTRPAAGPATGADVSNGPRPGPAAPSDHEASSHRQGPQSQPLSLRPIANGTRSPLPVFESPHSLTSLLVADAESLSNHPLVRDFRGQLESLPLVASTLDKLPPACHEHHAGDSSVAPAVLRPNGQDGAGVDNVAGKTIDKVISSNVEIIRVPTAASYRIGPAVAERLALPAGVAYFAPGGIIGQPLQGVSRGQDVAAGAALAEGTPAGFSRGIQPYEPATEQTQNEGGQHPPSHYFNNPVQGKVLEASSQLPQERIPTEVLDNGRLPQFLYNAALVGPSFMPGGGVLPLPGQLARPIPNAMPTFNQPLTKITPLPDMAPTATLTQINTITPATTITPMTTPIPTTTISPASNYTPTNALTPTTSTFTRSDPVIAPINTNIETFGR